MLTVLNTFEKQPAQPTASNADSNEPNGGAGVNCAVVQLVQSDELKYYNGSAWVAIVSDTDVKVSVSANDTTPGFLNGKLVAGTNISLTEGNDGGNETLTIAATSSGATAGFAVAMAIAL